MISVTIEQLYAWMNGFLWPFFRILGLMATAPLFSESAISTKLKVGFAAALAIAIAPALGPMPNLPTASFAALFLAVQQVIIGIALGLVMRIVFATVQTAGEFIGLQMGLSFASFFDPATGSNTAVLSRLLNLVSMLVFLAVNGHLIMLSVLFRTFDILPIQVGSLNPNGWGVLVEWSSQLMVSGLLLALPLIIVLLTINLAFGILNRTAQQLTVFAVGFPITLLVGLILLTVVVPQITPFLTDFFDRGYEAMLRLTYRLSGA
ncbi:flagellar biosynthetic protein FliR [Paenalcaligenes niemegkensis]|uniref:flagellar biosynthetic protein FliR n=1 Tax=Paenalcaligenes niemegkensis TaxID=2895469 RepID=UPI001EE79EC7|nr:flagellar biosynthetic protein FliR [Paenalcaligenes niemegkensis]MCQ9615998.1 flagellar biosynthetic protein FliR [Paenalcaligenes niemegkensis]